MQGLSMVAVVRAPSSAAPRAWEPQGAVQALRGSPAPGAHPGRAWRARKSKRVTRVAANAQGTARPQPPGPRSPAAALAVLPKAQAGSSGLPPGRQQARALTGPGSEASGDKLVASHPGPRGKPWAALALPLGEVGREGLSTSLKSPWSCPGESTPALGTEQMWESGRDGQDTKRLDWI